MGNAPSGSENNEEIVLTDDDALSEDDYMAHHRGYHYYCDPLLALAGRERPTSDRGLVDLYTKDRLLGRQQDAMLVATHGERVLRSGRRISSTPAPNAATGFIIAVRAGCLEHLPLVLMVRLGSVICKDALEVCRAQPLDLMRLHERPGGAYDMKRFGPEQFRAIADGPWRVCSVALWHRVSRAVVRGLPLAGVTRLDLAYFHFRETHHSDKSRLKTLDCLSACPALTHLDLSRRFGIRDLAPIADHLPLLETLVLRECVRATDLSPLARCPRLESLDLSMTEELQDVTLQPLSNVARLRVLRLTWCLRITRLPELTQLTTLYLVHCTGIQDLQLCGLPEHLKTLSLCWGYHHDRNGANLSNLAPLAACDRLTSLDLSNSKRLGSLDALALLPLVELNLEDVTRGAQQGDATPPIDLTPLGDITSLVRLNLKYNGRKVVPESLAVVARLPALEELALGGSGFHPHLISGAEKLHSLDLSFMTDSDEPGVALDISFLPSLPSLTRVDLSHNDGLNRAPLKRCQNVEEVEFQDEWPFKKPYSS